MRVRKRVSVYMARLLAVVMLFSTFAAALPTRAGTVANAEDGTAGTASGTVVYSADFETGTDNFQGFNGTATVAQSADVAHTGTHSLAVTNRGGVSNGAMVNVKDKTEVGATYKVSAYVKLATGAASSATLQLSVKYTNSNQTPLTNATRATVTADGDWAELTGEFTKGEDWTDVKL